MADDHSAHAISAYGSKINETPNIDRISARGVRLSRCFCTNSICTPSRAAILTGQYSNENGVYTLDDRFDGIRNTVEKDLQAAGYDTAMIGKWHLQSDPTGFDFWKILPGQVVYYDPTFITMGKQEKSTGYCTDLIGYFTLDWLKKRDTSRPFFLMCHHKAPHRPCDRIVGALANLGRHVSDQTVGNILKRYGIAPAPRRSQNTTWKAFIAIHMAVLSGTDFFTVEVLTWRGLVTYYVLFFIRLETRRVSVAGVTRHPNTEWMLQMARNTTDEVSGALAGQRYVLLDRDTKFCSAFRDVLQSSGHQPLVLPPRSPNLNAFAERWVVSLNRSACLN